MQVGEDDGWLVGPTEQGNLTWENLWKYTDSVLQIIFLTKVLKSVMWDLCHDYLGEDEHLRK